MELERIAPGVPLLALGQTVLWDEPMKGGIALKARQLGLKRKLIAGVHDTDYFAKLPSGPRKPGRFAAVTHNDTTTKGLWSAAGEFSALFGSETVVTKSRLAQSGLRLALVSRDRPTVLDEATEAWRWQGIVSLAEDPPLAAEVPLDQLFQVLQSTLDWALEESLSSLGQSEQGRGREILDRIHSLVCESAEAPGSETLTGFYRNLLPRVYDLVAGQPVPLEATVTSELLRLAPETAGLARFQIADLFINPETRPAAKEAYDEAIRGSEIYELSRFGTGAIPFDLVIPGGGRGTIRLGSRGAVIMTREPRFLSFKKPLRSIREFAEAVTAKFGPECVLIGKAVTLIGMLSREFVFVFHEGASSYVKHSRRFHDLLEARGFSDSYNPILRVRYRGWDNLSACCSWLKLPEPLSGAFGTEELSGPSFSSRWREVGESQRQLLERLGSLKSPLELIRFLEGHVGGAWQALAAEYQELHVRLEGLAETVRELRKERHACLDELRELKQLRVKAERAKGEHFRKAIFERDPKPADQGRREELTEAVDKAVRAIEDTRSAIAELQKRQYARVSDPSVLAWHQRRRAIELEAELKRMRLIRQAVVASSGLERAGDRPSAWWFPLVCPGGSWFNATLDNAEAYLEPLATAPKAVVSA
jgi:hypothetical protein